MQRETTSVVYARSFLSSMLATWSAVPGAALVVTPKLRLMGAGGITPTPDNVLADFTAVEADFSGYPAGGAAITLAGPVSDGISDEGEIAEATFIATAAVPFVSDTVTGWFVTAAGGLVASGNFGPAGAAPMGAAGAWLAVTLVLTLSGLMLPEG